MATQLGPDDDATKPDDGTEVSSSGLGILLAVGQTFSLSYPLNAPGDVLIGRNEDAELRLPDQSVSRRHAMLHVAEGAVTIEDLGSVNGTRLASQKLQPGARVELRPGDVLEVGEVVVVVRLNQAGQTPELISREDLVQRLEAARGEGAPFAVGRIGVAPAHADAARNLMLKRLRSWYPVAEFEPGEFVVFLSDAQPSEARELHDILCEHLRDLRMTVRAGLACHPSDGTTVAALLARAGEGTTVSDDASAIVVDEAMKRLHLIVERIAPSPISVLLIGETGVGKEIFAERIHRLSDRGQRPLLRLNCAALPESLLEAELFGYEKGAFTGAAQSKPGLLETASGGTVFLDEIGELPPALQAKLLRVLEAGEVLPVGGLKARSVDLRIIAATHRDLQRDLADGRFRPDLFFRLNGISLAIPPLRERKAEIVPLARAFVSRAAARAGRSPEPTLSDDAIADLEAHHWPGNVRELRNVMERTVLLVRGPVIDGDALLLSEPTPTPWAPPSASPLPAPAESLDMRAQRSQLERTAIAEALARARGNQTRAARLLGIARSTLIKRMELYGMPRPRKLDDEN